MERETQPSQVSSGLRGKLSLRDRSLITGRGIQNGRGVQVKFYPTKGEGADGKGFSHAKGNVGLVLT